MDKAPYCAEAFSPITAASRWSAARMVRPAVTFSNENDPSRFRAYPRPGPAALRAAAGR
jgi:hypothetical protein